MRTKVIMTICLFLLMVGKASAQWSVIDPTNIAQSIINSSNNIVHTSSTAQNMINNFKETVKIYEQGKKYYDALKSVNNLVKDARKVQQTILMVGDITDIYINNYQKMMHDDNFSVEELSAIGFGYTKLLEESNDVLTELKNVVNITTLSMTDVAYYYIDELQALVDIPPSLQNYIDYEAYGRDLDKENTDKVLKYGIYRHLPTYEKVIRNLVSF